MLIRRARSLGDYQACIDIQKEVWKFGDPGDYASVPLMLVQNRYGGSVLVAEGPDGRVLSFAYALLCRDQENGDFWWSHMTAVSPELRGKEVGFELKLAQREEALRQGISRIQWTFDPLQAANAHFNIRKLGAVALDYEENLYGVSSSALHHGLPTDRLRVRWDLSSERVVDRVRGAGSLILRDFDGIVRILESGDGSPGEPDLERSEDPLLLGIPAGYPAGGKGDSVAVHDWQQKLRKTFGHYFGQGYIVTDFILMDPPDRRAFYVLERNGQIRTRPPARPAP